MPLLKQKPINITLHQLDNTKSICISNAIQKAAQKYNINIRFKYHHDYSTLLPLYRTHQLDGFIELYVFDNREAYNVFESFKKNSGNHANVTDNSIDVLLQQSTQTSSYHNRFQIYHQLAKYMQDNNIVIPLLYMDHGNLMKKCLSGISDDFFFNPYAELPSISKTINCT